MRCDLEALLYRKMFCSSKLMIPARWTHFKDACLLSHSSGLLCFANFCLMFDWTRERQRFLVTCWHFVLLLKQSEELLSTASDHHRLRSLVETCNEPCDDSKQIWPAFRRSFIATFISQYFALVLTSLIYHFWKTLVRNWPFLTCQLLSNFSGTKHFCAVKNVMLKHCYKSSYFPISHAVPGKKKKIPNDVTLYGFLFILSGRLVFLLMCSSYTLQLQQPHLRFILSS